MLPPIARRGNGGFAFKPWAMVGITFTVLAERLQLVQCRGRISMEAKKLGDKASLRVAIEGQRNVLIHAVNSTARILLQRTYSQ